MHDTAVVLGSGGDGLHTHDPPVLGAGGGAALGAGVAFGGIPKIFSDTVGGFKKGLKSGGTAKGKLGGALVRGLMGLGTSTAKATGMGAGG